MYLAEIATAETTSREMFLRCASKDVANGAVVGPIEFTGGMLVTADNGAEFMAMPVDITIQIPAGRYYVRYGNPKDTQRLMSYIQEISDDGRYQTYGAVFPDQMDLVIAVSDGLMSYCSRFIIPLTSE